MPSDGFTIGLDLGQSHDYSALCVLCPDAEYRTVYRRREELYDALEAERHRDPYADDIDRRESERALEHRLEMLPDLHLPDPVFEVRHLERPPLGTSYVAVARRVREIMHSPALQPDPRLVVDQTGVGRAVVDLLQAQGLSFDSVTITAGEKVSQEGRAWRIPKRELISRAQVALQNRRLKIAPSLPEAPVLVEELQNFRLKVSAAGNEKFEAWREGAHDDLVLATCLALYFADRPSYPVNETLVDSGGLFDAVPDSDLYTLEDDLF